MMATSGAEYYLQRLSSRLDRDAIDWIVSYAEGLAQPGNLGPIIYKEDVHAAYAAWQDAHGAGDSAAHTKPLLLGDILGPGLAYGEEHGEDRGSGALDHP